MRSPKSRAPHIALALGLAGSGQLESPSALAQARDPLALIGNAAGGTSPVVEQPLNASASNTGTTSDEAPGPVTTPNADIPQTGTTAEELVTVDFRGTYLGDVLRTLAAAASLNIVLGTSVPTERQVTMTLSNVTYMTALKKVLEVHDLEAQTRDNIVRIETIEKMATDLERKEALKVRELNSQPTRVMVWQLNYATAQQAEALIQNIRSSMYRNLQSFSVSADARTNKIIIESIPEVLERAKAALKVLDVKRRQVLIEARILEASRGLGRTLGVNWGARFGADSRNGLATGLIFPSSIAAGIGGAGALGSTAPAEGFARQNVPASNSIGLSLGSINNLINVDAILTAFEQQEMVNVIAAPRVVVEDQVTAEIGENTAIPRIVSSGAVVTTITSNIELSLKVTPQITQDGNINMQITVARGVPGSEASSITTRRAQTSLSVLDGETAVIGGLYQSSTSQQERRIPILGQIPIIGWLFRSRQNNNARSELMVLLTPKIVKEKIASSGVLGGLDAPAPGMVSSPGNLDLAPENNSENSNSFGNLNNSNTFSNNGNNSFSNLNSSGNNGNSANNNVNSSNSNNASTTNNTSNFSNSNEAANNTNTPNNSFSNNEALENNFANDEFSNNTNGNISNNGLNENGAF